MLLRKRMQQGFTLLELVMVIVIIGVISVVLGKMLYQSVNAYTTSQNVANIDWNGLIALERLTTDIHSIRSPSSISTATSSQLTFVNMSGTTIQYSLSGTSLVRSSQILATGVTGLTFGYLTKTGATTSTASAIRYITISLTLTQGNINSTFTTLVGLRGVAG